MGSMLEKTGGKVKEVTGKVTGDEKLEAKGKIQQKTAEVKEATDNAKEKVAAKANDVMDKIDG